MRARAQRAWLIGGAGVLLAGAAALVFFALGDTVSYSRTPSQIVKDGVEAGTRLRIGGLVGVDSIKRGPGTLLSFDITDGVHDVSVRFSDIPPDLFEEGQGIVAEGVLEPDGVLAANRLVARHDENYMPKEAYEAIKAAGGKDAADAARYGGASHPKEIPLKTAN